MMSERAMEHRCRYVLMVAIDDLGIWRFFTPAWTPISHCPRCQRLLSRRQLRPVIRESVRGTNT